MTWLWEMQYNNGPEVSRSAHAVPNGREKQASLRTKKKKKRKKVKRALPTQSLYLDQILTFHSCMVKIYYLYITSRPPNEAAWWFSAASFFFV
jgi:hypothetical protein